MVSYIIKRLLLMVLTLFGIVVITFVVTRLTPGQPGGMAQTAVAQTGVSFDDIIEQNRRNLGLDKPMLVNLNFEDRHFAAEMAVRDFIRRAFFWQRDAERRLRLSGAIAIEPALEILDALAERPQGVDHFLREEPREQQQIDAQDAFVRLLGIMPQITQHRDERVPLMAPEEQLAYWHAWFEENRGRYAEENVRAVVERFMREEASSEELTPLGGFAVPFLMREIGSRDSDRAQRANSGLSALTGFSYRRSQDNWEEERAEVVRRWRSLWARERIRYSEFNQAQHAFNILANTQFGVWMGQIVRLDFGSSYRFNRSVNQLIIERLPVTLLLSGLSIVIGYLIAIPAGIYSAVKRDSAGDRTVTLTLFILYSLPSFWTAQMLLLVSTGGPSPIPGIDWPDLFPTRGLNREGYDWQSMDPRAWLDTAHHLVLPLIAMTYTGLAFLSRQMRSAMLETLGQDFVRTAVAKGLNPRTVIFRHVLRNSLIPIITISSGLLSFLIAGSIVIEQIFTIQGMGLLSFDAILNRDYPLINAVLFFAAVLTLVGILLADLSYAIVDPRISYE